jgi:Zn-dependent M28 family amino/carboxypeptidase
MTLYPRSYDHATKLDAAGKYIRDAFAAAGAAVEVQEVRVQGEPFFNVIARFGPSTGAVLVVGAHYDSHGDPIAAAKVGKLHHPDTHTPGADDNASGVAGLIELSYLLGKNPPTRSVELVAYTLEEPPHFRTGDMGSVWHARSLTRLGRPVELAISLEMIGYFSDVPNSQTFPAPGMGALYPTTGNFIAIVGRPQEWLHTRRLKAAMTGASDLAVRSINTIPALTGVDFSDHRSYWTEGIPAVMITNTAFYRNTAYHSAEDTHERLDYARMAKVVQGVFAFLARPDAEAR